MVPLTTWVPTRAAAYLKDIFARLADPGERGEDYRRVVDRWLYRRRVQAACYPGDGLSAEIDLPFFGPSCHRRPAGGRIIGSSRTWIELTPDEAEDISVQCQRAISAALNTWVVQHHLIGKKRDHTGVALGRTFCKPGYQSEEGESIIRPKDDGSFEKNEAAIAHDVERAALQAHLHPGEDLGVVYYPGIHGIPSRCHVVHRREGDRVLFALGHIEHGGTSPTKLIEELAVRMHRRFYPDIPFDRIEWFDAWPPSAWLRNKFHMQRVVFQGGAVGTGPVWVGVKDVPNDFIDEVRHTITPKPAAASATSE